MKPRQIKFRAWDEEKRLWFFFDISQNPKYWADKIHDCPLQQFTGLLDKNGKEIFEGDILELQKKLPSGKPLRVTVEFPDDYLWLKDDFKVGNKYLVVGNIYQNNDQTT